MKYSLSTPLVGLDGRTPIKDQAGTPATFKSVAVVALLGSQDREGGEKYSCFALATKIESCAGDTIELATEEVARIKRLVGESMTPLAVGRMFDLLDQKAPEPPSLPVVRGLREMLELPEQPTAATE